MTMDKPLMMKELPETERPREKMLDKGAQALSNAELLAILLRTGTKNLPVNRLAEQLLVKYDLTGLGSISPQELSKTAGIGLVKAVTVVAGIELGRRLSQKEPGERPVIRSPKDAAHLMMGELRYQTKEHFIALLLSTKNHVIARAIISVGSLNASVVHPRELFREAISYSAAAVILVHNHPSGDPAPSQEDISLTKQLVEAGNLLNISVLDHVIIGDGKYVSFKEKGII
ncbi:RadC family protein [Sporomusa sp.]|uniref:RadC family protein n=1 Tax=Sporomusa sp. TaxID=2078658 RepID=UPI002CA4E6C7|nr:DNA repair protein RadC [Sporomusa sp.]HWR44639.1 DNA repair protein RadC [Sporomusa sp.]